MEYVIIRKPCKPFSAKPQVLKKIDTKFPNLTLLTCSILSLRLTKSCPVDSAAMSGQSSVGQGSVYEAGDQRNVKKDDIKTADRYNEGVSNSHKPNDSSMWTCQGKAYNVNDARGRAQHCQSLG